MIFGSEVANIKYIYYYLLLNKKLFNKKKGDNMRYLTTELVNEIEIPSLPSIKNQERLAFHIEVLYQHTVLNQKFKIKESFKEAKDIIKNSWKPIPEKLSDICVITDVSSFTYYILRGNINAAACFIKITKLGIIDMFNLLFYLYYSESLRLFGNLDSVTLMKPYGTWTELSGIYGTSESQKEKKMLFKETLQGLINDIN